MSNEATPLWEHDHPYYCAEGNFYARPDQGLHTEWDSWDEFVADAGLLYDGDMDLNLLFRWDWQDYTADGEGMQLQLHWVLQRKAILRSDTVAVTRKDEQAVRAWLEPRAAKMRELWAPFLTVT